MNRVTVTSYQNSLIVVDSLVLFEMSPVPYTIETGSSGTIFVVKTGVPKLTAGIFQPTGTPKPNISAYIDGIAIANSSTYRDTTTGIFTYKPSSSSLSDGNHIFKITVSAGSMTKTDSVMFEVRARPVQIQSPPFTTRKGVYITAGFILAGDGSGIDTTISSVTISVNGVPRTIPASKGVFFDSTAISEGINIIKISTPSGSDSVKVIRIVNHTPFAKVSASITGNSVQLSAAGTSDPDGQTITNFKWLDDPVYPLGLSGKTGVTATITVPAKAGEYYFSLIATDPDGNADTTRSYFIVNKDGSVVNPVIAGNPSWAKKARVYFLFPKAASISGTINAAALRLPIIQSLGFNVIWMMPVMKNAYPIDNNIGPGYNIVDFYNVAPEYGTNQDFKNFISQAHALGIKVILDVTPNHTSRFHPWSQNAHTLKTKSPYWNWYEHTAITHNTNGLGQSFDADGFNYYSGFSDQLLNFNWRDTDAQAEMINVYKYWVREFGLDGYRFDVYWGPHRRYGEQYMGKPVRDALKHLKPDLLLLAEDDGTGGGTEAIYADNSVGGINGGVDAGYDFKLYFNQIRGFYPTASIDNLHGDIFNGGFYPGPNSLYMRFMESQDEDRITSFYNTGDATSTFQRTMPMATTIFTVPGFPLIWNGQEVGWGYGISGSKEARNRSVIGWDYQGKTLLTPHYQRLAWIRGTFSAFITQTLYRLTTNNGSVYAFVRPYENQNAIVAVNFSSNSSSVSFSVDTSRVIVTNGVVSGKPYFLNDVYNDTSTRLSFQAGSAAISTTLPPFGSSIYILADSMIKLSLPTSVTPQPSDGRVPGSFTLEQNYPNPFNPSTTIRYGVPASSFVTLTVYDMLGREVAVPVRGWENAGSYSVQFDASPFSSGMYLYKLTAGRDFEIKRMMFLK